MVGSNSDGARWVPLSFSFIYILPNLYVLRVDLSKTIIFDVYYIQIRNIVDFSQENLTYSPRDKTVTSSPWTAITDYL